MFADVWGGARHQFPNVPTTTCLDSAGKCVPHGLSHVDPTTGSSPMSRAEQRSTCGHPKSRALGCTEATTFLRKMAGAPTVRQPAKANAAALILEPSANTNASWRAGGSLRPYLSRCKFCRDDQTRMLEARAQSERPKQKTTACCFGDARLVGSSKRAQVRHTRSVGASMREC